MVCWECFTWEAFSTLTAGALAVAAAWWIGCNQLEIQRRQSILIENDLKIQLLEKRTECVEHFRDIHFAYMREGKLSHEQMHRFYKLLERAQILYPPRVSKKLDEAVTAAFWSKQHMQRASNFREDGNQEHAQKGLEQARAEDDKLFKLLPELLQDLVEETRIDAWE